MIVPGRDPGGGGIIGLIITIAIGIGGALLGGFLSVAIGVGDGVDDFDVGTIFLAIVGSIIILAVWKLFARSSVQA
jgi:uncharacterized membrane protein YeaQ/YmgE (transglycosylase-associated protein family)